MSLRRSCLRSCRCSRDCGSSSISTQILRTIDGHLTQGGLDRLVARMPGIRIPGTVDGFDIALRVLLRGHLLPAPSAHDLAQRVTRAIGEPLETGVAGLTHLAASAERIAEAGSHCLRELGVSARRAHAVVDVAQRVASGALKLEPGSDVIATRRTLMEIDGVGDRIASYIVMRTLSWPDAFPFACEAMAPVVGAPSARAFRALSQRWRPWRAYAAMHLVRSQSPRDSLLPDSTG